MHIVQKYQNDVYNLALSLTGNAEKSKNASVKAFESVLKSYYSDSPETKIELYKKLLERIGVFSVKKKELDKKGSLNSVKHALGLFDKKVFVLKYECGCGIQEISYILGSNREKIKKSLLKSTKRMADILEGEESEVRRNSL
jgi:hypothetical protein